MNCSVYMVDLNSSTRTLVGTVVKHTDTNEWLKSYGNTEYIYEIWKGVVLHSRWVWKYEKKHWGRMATPSKKKI